MLHICSINYNNIFTKDNNTNIWRNYYLINFLYICIVYFIFKVNRFSKKKSKFAKTFLYISARIEGSCVMLRSRQGTAAHFPCCYSAFGREETEWNNASHNAKNRQRICTADPSLCNCFSLPAQSVRRCRPFSYIPRWPGLSPHW